ncbi:hypothetical protein ATK36_5807 [Amycolatopsis sulphurea]|uniref:Uncharacterized protein n=1 Tax=Amycolatopsis sulphurea TaxID=76022 RepID=A0A2A9FII4_9PSEU|nr:hypothetical protein [Amycolatopsis sulphurea]PFG50566.1 hypothetical protein ATK36_5807 [Amycolatopsis sulphurea]
MSPAAKRGVLIGGALAVVDRGGKAVVLSGAGGLRLADDKTFPLLRSALTSQAQASGCRQGRCEGPAQTAKVREGALHGL